MMQDHDTEDSRNGMNIIVYLFYASPQRETLLGIVAWSEPFSPRSRHAAMWPNHAGWLA